MSYRNIVIFLGPPGAGKGTLANLCTSRLNWQQLSTGNLCRKHITQGTNLGKEIDFAIKSGKLVSDSLIMSMVKQWFEQLSDNKTIIFDGFPRTIEQAELLNNLVHELANLTVHIVHFVIPDSSVIARICGRYICQNKDCQAVFSALPDSLCKPKIKNACDYCNSVLTKRSDDTQESIKHRLEVYHLHECELLNYYSQSEYNIIKLEADRSLALVYDEFLTKMEVAKG